MIENRWINLNTKTLNAGPGDVTVWSMLRYRSDKVSGCCCKHMTVLNDCSSGIKSAFFLVPTFFHSALLQPNNVFSWPMGAHHPLRLAGLYRSCNRRKIGTGASDNVCEIAYAPASIKSDMWKHVGFPVSRNGKGKTEDNMHTLPDYIGTHLWHWFAHATLKV